MPIKDKKVKFNNQSQIEKRLPELKPNSEPPPKFQRPAKITPNPMLQACAIFVSFFLPIFVRPKAVAKRVEAQLLFFINVVKI